MKKIYTSLLATALLSGTAVAQQLPNVGFENWKSTCGDTEAFGFSTGMRQRPSTEPSDWNGSSVNQKVVIEKKETMVKETTGTSGKGVELTAHYVGALGIGSNAPGFITLGTPWVAANTSIANCDGGVYGGIAFEYRPDALTLDVKRTDSNDEVSTIIAYSWTGTFKSKVGMKNDLKDTRDDVDRAIWGSADASIVESEGETVAKLMKTFKGANSEWVSMEIPFEYLSDVTPEKLNVIVCSGDYWNRDNMLDKTQLLVDNVKLVYYSRLSSITIGGTALEGFAPDKFTYQVEGQLPSSPMDIDARLLGAAEWAEITATINNADNTVTITVSNDQGADIDGKTSHTYTISFKAAAQPTGDAVRYPGTIDVTMMGTDIASGQEAVVEMTPYSDGTYTLVLPNFGLDIDGSGDPTPLGDIVVPGVKAEGSNPINYTGAAKGFKLLGGAIVADIDLTGTEDASGNVTMNIDVNWDNQGTIVPIAVTFNGQREGAQPAELSYRRKYTDSSSRYYSEIAYMVNDNVTTVYSTADPTAESYYVKPVNGAWQEEGAYIDFTDKVIEVPYDAKQFTVILKGLPNTAIHWSQTCVYVDWNNNGSFIDAGETNGVVNRDIKPNAAGGGLVITDAGERDVINLPAGVAEGDTFPMLIALTEPKGVNGDQDLWSSHWEWSTEIFNNNLCSLINGQAYGLTLKMGRELSAIDNVAVDNADAPAEFFNLQGVRVDADNLTPGIYIMRKGNDVKKVLVK